MIRLKRTDEGYAYPPLGVSVSKAEMGGVGTGAPRMVWWDVETENASVLARTLDDVRVFLADIEAARR